MDGIFGIPANVFFDKNKLKIISGIAGAAKSSNIDEFFKRHYTAYLRTTSTHRLRIDAEERYQMPCHTIASALFNNDNGCFFSSEKDVSTENIVIDEALQTNGHVLKWIENNVGKSNIIVTTDMRQMLAPGSGDSLLQAFKELTKKPYTVFRELEKSYRPRDAKTAEMFEKLYHSVNNKSLVWQEVKQQFPQIEYSKLSVTEHDVYICHTNDLEELLYSDNDLYTAYYMPLIPKGQIAKKKPKEMEKYPICPQNKVGRNIRAYFQIANIATPTRFQGSEVDSSRKLYYLVEDYSEISNREIYTVVTRCHSIDSIVIVNCKTSRKVYKTFCNKPIVDDTMMDFNDSIVFPDGETLGEKIMKRQGKNLLLTDAEMNHLRMLLPDLKNVHFDRDFFFCGGVLLRHGAGDEEEEKRNQMSKTETTIQSLLKKEPELKLSYAEDACQIVANTTLAHLVCEDDIDQYIKLRGLDHLKGVCALTEECEAEPSYQYEIDLFSSYPYILFNERVPIDGNIHEKYDNQRINYYLYLDNPFYPVLPDYSIFTDSMKDVVDMFPEQAYTFLFSVDCKKSSRMGSWGVIHSLKSTAQKRKVKEIRWGFLAQPFYSGFYNATDIDYYIRNASHSTELLMLHIRSCQLAIMLNCQMWAYGNIRRGRIVADALHFNGDGETLDNLTQEMKKQFPNYPFRIRDNKNNEIVIQTYESPPTEKELARLRKEKSRRKNK